MPARNPRSSAAPTGTPAGAAPAPPRRWSPPGQQPRAPWPAAPPPADPSIPPFLQPPQSPAPSPVAPASSPPYPPSPAWSRHLHSLTGSLSGRLILPGGLRILGHRSRAYLFAYLTTALLIIVLTAGTLWWLAWQINEHMLLTLQYGPAPRTTWTTARLGLPEEGDGQSPSQITAINRDGIIRLIIDPGGDVMRSYPVVVGYTNDDAGRSPIQVIVEPLPITTTIGSPLLIVSASDHQFILVHDPQVQGGFRAPSAPELEYIRQELQR